MQKDKTEIKVAIIDLYADYPNQAMRDFTVLLNRYKQRHEVNLSYQIFDLRGNNQVPGIDFDLYISSGGPGSPVDSVDTEWEAKYWALIDAISVHNASVSANKKHVLFVCHSFQLMCRRYGLGIVNQRDAESFGIVPVHQTPQALSEFLFEGLASSFLVVDSREWQVVHPDPEKFKEMGAVLLAIEDEREDADMPRAMMAIRFNQYFLGTQFHPEADPLAMKTDLLDDKGKQLMIDEYGEEKYNEILNVLNTPDKILLTHSTIIPNFLYAALHSLQHAQI